MLWILSLVMSVSLPQGQGFRGHLTIEEQGQKADYVVHVKEGAIRIEPQNDEDILVLLEIEEKTVIIVETQKQIFCRADAKGYADLAKANLVRESWFPWVYQVSRDLVAENEIREVGPVLLSSGTRGWKTDVYSLDYSRVVAEYWTDPEVSGDLFFLWRKIYFDFWSQSDELDDAQRARFEIYDQLRGLPRRMEERFRLLTAPRILTVEQWSPAQEDWWSVPDGFNEKSVAQLIWEGLVRRFERWLRPKGPLGERQSWTRRVR